MNENIGWAITASYVGGDYHELHKGQTKEEADATIADNIVTKLFTAEQVTLPPDKLVKWRSFEDNGENCFDGIVNIDWLYPLREELADFAEPDPAFNIDRFNLYNCGGEIVLYNVTDIRRCRPTMTEFMAGLERPSNAEFIRVAGIEPNDWVELFGYGANV